MTDDTKADSDTLVKKILNAKLFEDAGEAWGSWKRSVKDIDGEVLCGMYQPYSESFCSEIGN